MASGYEGAACLDLLGFKMLAFFKVSEAINGLRFLLLKELMTQTGELVINMAIH